jgi:flagella basal body P-ring formation protein FlgA
MTNRPEQAAYFANRNWFAGILLCFAASFYTQAGIAAPVFQSHDDIRAAVHKYLTSRNAGLYESNAQVEVGSLDKRLKLSKCTKALTTFLPHGSKSIGNTSVGVRCDDEKPWTLYVKARISVITSVVVAKSALVRGQKLTSNNVKLEKKELGTLVHGYFTNTRDAIGKVAKRSFRPNELINPALLEAPKLVRRGERVTVVAEIDGIRVHMKGKALADGTSGDRVRVKNITSKKIVEGTVIGTNMVKVSI